MRRDEQSINASEGKFSDQPALQTEDSALAAAVLARDRKATAEFVSRYADRIYSYVCWRLMPRTDFVEDLVQDVFLAAWQSLPSFRGQSSLESWLLGIARHKIQEHYRMRLRAPDPLEENSVEMDKAALIPELEEKLDEETTRQKTRRVLASLPENYRMALLWRYWEKCPAQEMAARTGKTEKSIERLLARARDHFRRMWQDV
ncbi:MAG: RNA polymerase sigma factor [Terriglobia bacterium]